MPDLGRHSKIKTGGKVAKSVASKAVTSAQIGTEASSTNTITALATGAAVGGSGVGLLIAAGALTLGGGALAGKSAYKTNKHINALKEIKKNWQRFGCSSKGHEDHVSVGTGILNYIIAKKRTKLHRKAAVAGTLGVLSSVETSRAIVKKAYKYCRGTLGEARHRNATILANHFIECDCELSDAIVAELYGHKSMLKMKGIDKYGVAELIMDKIKSV